MCVVTVVKTQRWQRRLSSVASATR